MAATCRSCGAPVIWCLTANGKRMPLDAEPADDGDFVLAYGDPPLASRAPGRSLFDEDLFTSHFATCPDADQWRQRPTQVCQCVACGHKFVNRTSACPKCKEMVP